MTEKAEVSPRRRRRTAAEIEQIKTEFASSGMKQREFCQSRGFCLSTLQRYLNAATEKPKITRRNPHLVAVEVAGFSGEDESKPGLAVMLRGGRKIEVQPGFDAITLQQLVNILEPR